MNRRKRKLLYIRERNALSRGKYITFVQVTNELLESVEESVIEHLLKKHGDDIGRKFKCRVESVPRFLAKRDDHGGRIINARTVVFKHKPNLSRGTAAIAERRIPWK